MTALNTKWLSISVQLTRTDRGVSAIKALLQGFSAIHCTEMDNHLTQRRETDRDQIDTHGSEERSRVLPMRLQAVYAAVTLVVLSIVAPAASAAVAAQGTISGSGTSYSLEVRNSGDETLARMSFTAADGVTITGSDGPGSPAGASSSSFSRQGLSIAPGAAAVFTFTTSAPYPANAGGTLSVANAAGRFVDSRATGPAPAPPPSPSPPPGVPAPDPLVPPLPSGNDDGDRVPNGRDLCPGTVRGFPARLKGCALVDFIVSPAALLEDAAESVGGLRGGRRSRRLLRAGLSRLRAAGARVARSPCRASGMARAGLRLADRGVDGIAGATRKRQLSIVVRATRFYLRHPAAKRDSDPFAFRHGLLGLKRADAKEALADLRRLRRQFAAACAARRGPTVVTGRVASTEGTVVRLGDGTRLVLGAAREVGGIARGVQVTASGTALKGKVVIVESAKAKGLSRKVLPSICTFEAKIAPVQDLDQAPAGILYYDRRGYLGGDTYQLEGGMGIGAQRGASCTERDEYLLQVSLTYRRTDDVTTTKLLGFVRGFPGSEPPLRLPNDVKPATKSTLTFELYGFDCTGTDLSGCGTPALIRKLESPARVRQQGHWGRAEFDEKIYSVEDGSTTDFDTAQLTGKVAAGLASSTVFGVGFGIAGGKSTYPNGQFILTGESFAVHDDVPGPAQGTGLFWAYLHGFRNGHVYHYAARLPELTTDMVSPCETSPRTFYRLPWKAGKLHKVTQGNFGSLTHKDEQRFAFDFVMPENTVGRATRGGVVEEVVENLTETSNPKVVKFVEDLLGEEAAKKIWKPGNSLWIEHMDGSWSYYTHMQPNGVIPDEGDVVERGDKVIKVGGTGNSTNPHLHYHVTGSQYNAFTQRIRFEVAHPFAPATAVPCVVPGKGAWISTNAKPGS